MSTPLSDKLPKQVKKIVKKPTKKALKGISIGTVHSSNLATPTEPRNFFEALFIYSPYVHRLHPLQLLL